MSTNDPTTAATRTAESALSPGRRLGGYQLLRKLGQGGMGVVYEAYEASLDRRVALKILPEQLTGDQEWVARFLREARTAARLEHPGIAAIHATDVTEDGVRFIAMQYIEGTDIGALLQERGALPVPVALEVVRQVAEALAEAHGAGIVHRDIKPDNLRLQPSGRVKVMDFGLAVQGAGARITQAGTFLGTPEYCSPEQCEGGAVDARSDLYSLGVTLYEMLTGQMPHRAPTPYALFRKIIEEPPVAVRELDGQIPVAVEQLVSRLIAKDPGARFGTAGEVVRAIDALLPDATDLSGLHSSGTTDDGACTVAFGSGAATELAHPTPAPLPATLAAIPSARPPTRGLPPWTSAATLLLLFLAAATWISTAPTPLLALVAAQAHPQLPAPVRIRARRLAIVGFGERTPGVTPERFRWLSSGLPEMLSIELARVAEVELVSAERVARAAQLGGPVETLARRLGAGMLARGTYHVMDQKLVLWVELLVWRDDRLVTVGGATQTGPVARFLEVIRGAAGQLVAPLTRRGIPRADRQAHRRDQGSLAYAVVPLPAAPGRGMPAPAASVGRAATSPGPAQRPTTPTIEGLAFEPGTQPYSRKEQEVLTLRCRNALAHRRLKAPQSDPSAGEKAIDDAEARLHRALTCFFRAKALLRNPSRPPADVQRAIELLGEALRLAPGQTPAEDQLTEIERHLTPPGGGDAR